MAGDLGRSESGRVRSIHVLDVFLQFLRVDGGGGLADLRLIADVFEKEDADGAAMLFVLAGEAFAGSCAGKTEAARQQGQRGRVVRQGVGLLIIGDLQKVFDRTQENVTIAKGARFQRQEQAGFAQAGNGLHGGAGADGRVGELQRLHDEFDIADGALAELDLSPLATFGLQEFFGALLHAEDAGTDFLRGNLENIGLDLAAQFLTEGQVPGNGPGFEKACFSHKSAWVWK